MSLADTFGGVDDDGDTPASDPDLDPAELSQADLLIADLRADGLEPTEANQVAIIVTTYAGTERGEKLRANGLKGKTLAAAIKRGKEYDAATKA